MTKNIAKRGRPRTGSIVWVDPKTKTQPLGVRITKANGKRKLVRFDPGTTPEDARALLPIVVERGHFAVDDDEAETVGEYAQRWCDYREHVLKLESASRDRAILKKYLGAMATRAMSDVTRDEIETLRDLLDGKVRAGDIAWKTGVNNFGIVTKMFRDACRSKCRELRVRADNPCADVEGPDRGHEKAKPFLWPSMFLAFVRDDRIPLAWRRLLAVATFLYLRPQELAALEWEDVRIDEGVVLVHRALAMHSTDRGRIKHTKTGTTRRVPIESNLRPLLEAMKRESNGRGRIVTMPSESRLPRMLRRYLGPALERANIEARDLFTADATRIAIDFRRATRDTGITWRAVRGDSPAKLMRACGHRDVKTTMLYVSEAEGFGDGFGEVFPSLPDELLGTPGVSASISARRQKSAVEMSRKGSGLVARVGFEPTTFGL